MKKDKQILTLYRPLVYQIKVPGQIDERWADWIEKMTYSIEHDADGIPITILVCTVDQAGLHGLLRRLYSLGLPLISVICLDA